MGVHGLAPRVVNLCMRYVLSADGAQRTDPQASRAAPCPSVSGFAGLCTSWTRVGECGWLGNSPAGLILRDVPVQRW